MNKPKLILLSAISLAALSLFACSSDEGGDKYDYCVSVERQACLSGPFSSCEEGWLPSNSCQYGASSHPSSSDEGGSSSSAVSSSSGGGSSSSAGGSSSSAVASGGIEGVAIGSQVWMKRNLDIDVPGSKCYDDDPSNCDKYGRLYDWATAMALPSSCNSSVCAGQIQAKHKGICPTGWHIPTNAEWDALYKHADSDYEADYENGVHNGHSETAGKHLKAQNGWNEDGNGEDTYGFAALPGGSGYSGGDLLSAGYSGYWWSASERSGTNAYHRYMYSINEDASWYHNNKTGLFSVRCVQD